MASKSREQERARWRSGGHKEAGGEGGGKTKTLEAEGKRGPRPTCSTLWSGHTVDPCLRCCSIIPPFSTTTTEFDPFARVALYLMKKKV